MLEFTCSSCGKRVQGDESLAGDRVQCSACKTTLDRKEIPRLIARWLTVVVGALVVLIAIGLFIPAMQKFRGRAAREQSTNNLKQIGLAMHAFHDANKRMPYPGRKREPSESDQRGCWAHLILPYMIQNPMLDEVENKRSGVSQYMCPGRGRPLMCTGAGGPGAWTDYFINSYVNAPSSNTTPAYAAGAVNAPDNKRTLAGITDGTSNTIFVGHGQINPDNYVSIHVTAGFTDIIFNGGSPGLARWTTINGPDSADQPPVPGNWGGPFAEGALMCMVDGTVRTFPYTITGGAIVNGVGSQDCDAVLRGAGHLAPFLTPNGGEICRFRD